MNKTKLITIIVSLIVIIFVGVILFAPSNNQPKYQNRIVKFCDSINENIKNKENIIILIKMKDTEENSNNTIDKLKENYSNNNIYELEFSEIENECIKKIFDKDNIYENISQNNLDFAILYENGEYAGEMGGFNSYKDTEDYLVEKNIIVKKTIKEEKSEEEYKTNIKDEKYLLLIMGDEKRREEHTNAMKKVFSDYKHDIINLNSNTGEKMRIEFEEKYNTLNEYPRIFYFENGEFIKSGDANSEYDLTYFKGLIENNN